MADAPNDPVTQRVREEVIGRLESRGVHTTSADTSEQLAQLLEAVEDFEATVERHGGDLMVDEPTQGGKATQPDDVLFVLPSRESGEAASAFIARIIEATADADQRS
ncbi:MAG TPA: hypothetical protein VGM82_03750 [Gemmatimonadaceae bacterium]|jgi:hypothetical protein